MPGWEDVIRSSAPAETIDEGYWREMFAESPETMYKILADVWKMAAGATGQPTLVELRQLLEPQYSDLPFADAVRALLGDRSVRWLAHQMGLHHHQVQRILTGEREVLLVHDLRGSLARIDQFAKALRVHPSYFAEWRRLWILMAVDSAFAVQPDLTVQFIEKAAGVRPSDAGKPRSRA